MKKYFLAILCGLVLTGTGCTNSDIVQEQQKQIDTLTSQLASTSNEVSQLNSSLPVKKTVQTKKTESSEVKIERCKALALSESSNLYSAQQIVDMINNYCSDPESLFPDETQPAYMTKTEYDNMLKKACLNQMPDAVNASVKIKEKNAYNTFYANCLNK